MVLSNYGAIQRDLSCYLVLSQDINLILYSCMYQLQYWHADFNNKNECMQQPIYTTECTQ